MSDETHEDSGELLHDDPHLTTVFSTSEADLIPVIKSVLRGAGIEYVLAGESLTNLFPTDMLGPTMHRSRGEVRFRVAEKDLEGARAVLAEHPGVPDEQAADGAEEGGEV